MANGVERLWKNVQGYYGETIDIAAVTRDCVLTARQQGWKVTSLRVSDKIELFALFRPASRPVANPFRLYISAGIHGDEPAGPLATRQLLQDNLWPAEMEIRI